MTSFDEQIDLMRKIFRGLEQYGPGSPSEQATRFRLEKLFPEVIRRAQAHSDTSVLPDVDLLVSLSGFSPATTILAFELIRPKQLFVISSEGTADSIDVINEHLVPRRIPARYFRHKSCDGTNPLTIYRLVKDEVAELASSRPGERTEAARQPTVLIDITGGKKVMSAAAALVAWQLDLRRATSTASTTVRCGSLSRARNGCSSWTIPRRSSAIRNWSRPDYRFMHRLLHGCDRCLPATAAHMERPQRGEDERPGRLPECRRSAGAARGRSRRRCGHHRR